MRIMHLLPTTKFSGAENVVCQIMSFFRNETSIEMIYCSPDGEIRDILCERGIHYSSLDTFSVKAIKKKIAQIKPDIIHAHDMKASVMAAIAGGKTPIISHIHVNNKDTRGLSFKAIIYMIGAIKAKHIFWVSNTSFNDYFFHNLLADKSEILMNIIDPIAIQNKADDDHLEYNYDIVFVGRLSDQKNPQRLIKIIKDISKRYPSIKAAIIGTGKLDDEIRLLAKRLLIEDSISFLGFLSNPYKIIRDAKVMLMTSRWEGTPMCALEALALGTPIVSTPVDGMKSLVDDGITGYLRDNDDQIVDSCLQLILDNRQQKAFSAASLSKAKIIMNIDSYKASIMSAYLKAIK